MRWFEGSIPAAIAAAKQRRCVFVVVITGSDDQSSQLMSSWETDSVWEAAQNCCVAIRVDAESEACVQFSQIYPVVCIPSSFFIGENGIPLEVIAGSVTEEAQKRRISKHTHTHTHTHTLMSSCVQMHTQQMSAERANETEEAASKESLSVPMEEDGASGHMTPAEDASQPDEALDSKVERITKKLEERREQKKKAEEENELRKEVERRKMGKEMLDFKKKQEEEKTKRLLEERNREKAEERAARERVKQQIALDRADRAARYAQSQAEVEAARVAALQARASEQESRRDAAQRERSAFARIQFRLPDGSSFTNQFPSETRLLEARAMLRSEPAMPLFNDCMMVESEVTRVLLQEVGGRYGQFSLATMFPRREFTDEDLQRSLLELELTPSASIVLLPQSSSAVVRSSASGGVWTVLGSLLYPLLSVWRYISSFLFSSAPAAPPPAPQNTHGPGAAAEPKRDAVRKRILEKRPEDFKKDGKIYRLRTQEDNEDDNNTWNGNSTQQM
ncbi:LOW QUALITY PROTEIN: UBX domain-containing protein 4-like [Puntigrus tetrazona]|uniref:LOW QUALITY PROTEIN: UBX domain-containing protein 4-like n=1 Tax=Puntigrus tetrazona TaxID=1606681 RepID=UPI001C8A0484|nr:LOW QUALITY PROTEIN: UBX domain-containing protein 4-like [Puntigrus tetrazona]